MSGYPSRSQGFDLDMNVVGPEGIEPSTEGL
jgi:hypothetical protein